MCNFCIKLTMPFNQYLSRRSFFLGEFAASCVLSSRLPYRRFWFHCCRQPYQTIWKIERGSLREPSIVLAQKIARTLGVGVDYLIGMFTEEEKDSERLAPAVA
jgi:helix-turn-helix protein